MRPRHPSTSVGVACNAAGCQTSSTIHSHAGAAICVEYLTTYCIACYVEKRRYISEIVRWLLFLGSLKSCPARLARVAQATGRLVGAERVGHSAVFFVVVNYKQIIPPLVCFVFFFFLTRWVVENA